MIVIKGIYLGQDQREFTRQADGKHVVVNYILLSDKADFYKISCDKEISGYEFGDGVEIPVTVRTYNGSLFYNLVS